MENFLLVSAQVAILFVLMAVGAGLRRFRLITDQGIESLVNLLLLMVTPCLIVDVFQRPFSSEMLRNLLLAFVLAVACHLAVIGLAALCVRHPDANVRNPVKLAAVFSNAGFMGIPLEQAILGESGVFFGIVYVVVFNLFMWSWGLRLMSPESSRENVRQKLKMIVNPGTVGIALGLPLFLFSVTLPEIVCTPIHLLAGLNTPLAMIVIGSCLWGAKLGRVARMPSVYVAAAIRLVICPLFVIAVLYPVRACLNRQMMIAVCIAASAPVAAMVSMFATKFGRDVDTSVALVSGTTLLSIITMPVIIALAMTVL